MKLTAICLIIIVLFLSASHQTNAQPGTLDESFGVGGKVITQVNGDNDRIKDVKILADNSILAVGEFLFTKVFLLKYRPDGSLDDSFGENGETLIDFDDFDVTHVASFALDKTGRILILASGSRISNYGRKIFLLKFLPSGKPDSSFANNSVLIDSAETDFPTGMILQSDGKIIASFSGMLVKRYFPDGKIDTSFGINGRQMISGTMYNNAIASCANGKILLSGVEYTEADSGRANFYVLRLTDNGSIDSTFGVNGFAKTDFDDHYDAACSVMEQPDGKILAGGEGYYAKSDSLGNQGYNYCIARYLPDGSPDLTFGINGKTNTDFINSEECILKMVLQEDGKIVSAGYFDKKIKTGEIKNFSMARFLPAGMLDSSFGTNGKVLTDFGDLYCGSNALDIGPDGKIVLAGYSGFTGAAGPTNAALARYNNEIVLPLTLISFTATKKENTSLFQWRTCNELNTKGFSIERSTDNKIFTPIGFVNAKGGSINCNNDYSFIDNTPVSGVNYYRLQVMDKDGKYSFSGIKNLSFIISSIIKISPNPVQNILKMEGPAGINKALSIVNAAGKIIATAKTSEPAYNWNIQSLPPGLYYLVVQDDNGEKQVLKFVKE